MPTAAPTRCLVPGCRRFAEQRGRCAEHYVPWESPSANTRTLSGRQRAAFRSEVLDRSPVCQWPGCTAPASEADHIVPIADGGARTDLANGQALCEPHHDLKTRLENAERNRRRAQARRRDPRR